MLSIYIPLVMMKLIELQDPLAIFVGQLSKCIINDFSKLAASAAKYLIKQKNEDVEFEKNVSKYFMADLPSHNYSVQGYQRQMTPARHQYNSYDQKESIELKTTPRIGLQNKFANFDRNAPMLKRPRNAYNIFVQSESVRIKEGNPHMRAPDIVRIAAEKYNSMNAQQKRPYVQRFEEAKKIFDSQHLNLPQGNNFSSTVSRRGRGSRGTKHDYTLK